MVAGNVRFKDKYKGKRCFILGNGPSIKDVDFKLLRDEYVFTVNQAARFPNFADLHSNFHVIQDGMLYKTEDTTEIDQEILELTKAINTGENKPEIFYFVKAHEYVE